MAEQNKRIQFLQDALSKLAKSVREVSKGLIDLEGVLSRLTGKTKTFAAEQKKAAASMDKTKKSVKEVSEVPVTVAEAATEEAPAVADKIATEVAPAKKTLEAVAVETPVEKSLQTKEAPKETAEKEATEEKSK